MSLARWEPFTQLRHMREEMDRLFESIAVPKLFAPWEVEHVGPAIDIFERDNNVILKAEVPGLEKEDIEVTATEDSISLKGEFKRDEEVEEEAYYRHERRSGRFYRTVPMPTAIRPDEVKATFHEGVLEVSAPRVAEAKPKEKRVPIEG